MVNSNTDFNGLLRSLKKGPPARRQIRVAVLADSASQHLAVALKAAAAKNGFGATVWEAGYDTIASTILDESSVLYQEEFHYVLLFPSTLKLYREFSLVQAKQDFAKNKAIGLGALLALLQERCKARILLCNFDELDDGAWGHFANKTLLSFLSQVRRLNVELMNLSVQQGNVYILDVQSLIAEKGRSAVVDPRLYIHADILYNLDFVALLAEKAAQIIGAAEGSFIKCVVLDLDNTLWGGIIGDDGIENIQVGDLGLGKAFSNLQLWLRNLKERGILLAVCSKNTEAVAKRVFEEHEGMTLRLSDIAVFVANWETKVDNLAFIRSVLNISYDSMVFLDDSPFEREMVKQHLPEITVPDLPEDPADYLPYLQSLHLFETASHTGEDADRTRQYQEEAGRASLQKTFLSEASFLESLEMKAVCQPINEFTRPRVAQLTQRSNQFNLRTRRYTEAEIAALMNDPGKLTLTVSLSDRFGNYGLISAVILEARTPDEVFVDTWIMSCRVLKRGVENLVLSELAERSRAGGYQQITGEYLPTAKNGLVKDHYSALGFRQGAAPNTWILCLTDFQPKPTFITKIQTHAFHE